MIIDNRRAKRWTHVLPLGVMALCASLTACNKAGQVPGQVIVKGQDFEITVQEYDQVLKQAPRVTRDAIMPMRRAILGELIAEKLLADEAVKAGLDKEATTAQAIAAARRTVLAQAYVQQLGAGALPPQEQDIRQYYDAHPHQFAQRERFSFNEYVVRNDLPNIRHYIDVLNTQGMAELGKALQAPMPAVAPVTQLRFSDELPERAGPAKALAAGDVVVYQTAGQLHLGQVQSVTSDPLSLDAVRDRISSDIMAKRRRDLVQASVDRLRKDRNIQIEQSSLADGSDKPRKDREL